MKKVNVELDRSRNAGHRDVFLAQGEVRGGFAFGAGIFLVV